MMGRREGLNVSLLYDEEKQAAADPERFLAFSTFQGWNLSGKKYARLAAAGTLYFLVLIVATHKVSEANKLTENDLLCVSNFLRHPLGLDFDNTTIF